MTFPYHAERRGGEICWLPYLPVHLHGSDGVLVVDALVDSGSEHSVFSPELADVLGVSLRGERRVVLRGIGGEVGGVLTIVECSLGKQHWTAPMIFTDAIGKRGILGQRGFFAFFTVTFRYRDKLMDIRWRR